MSEFYPAEFTTRSRSVLELVMALVPEAILIGGWGTWVRTQGAMSHDIDLIVDNRSLDAMRAKVDDLSSTDHLGARKWRATLDGIHLDLYVLHQSCLGQRLGLRVEKLAAHAESIGQWRVLTIPAHTATKIAALLDRPDTKPGAKDRVEILSLLPQTTAADIVSVIAEASSHELGGLRGTLGTELFAYLDETQPVTKQQRAAVNAWRREWVGVLGSESP